eukprot:1721372-Prymnesium_polylepis.1
MSCVSGSVGRGPTYDDSTAMPSRSLRRVCGRGGARIVPLRVRVKRARVTVRAQGQCSRRRCK